MRSRLLLLFLSFLFIGSFLNGQEYWSPKYEARGLWVTTIHNLDWPTSRNAHPDEQKEEFVRLIKLAERCNINTFFVQIRNASDAFYDSKIEPWSQWLTGKQGKAPDPYWDPLEFMIEECHKRNIEFHAWFNPFRAVSHVEFSDICRQHISKKHKDWCFQYENTLYLDPGIPEARKYIVSVINDVTKRYDIDGIHLDDYFYPYQHGNEYLEDYSSYIYNNPNKLDKDDWRRENVNQLVKDIRESTLKIKKNVIFGISPIAVWRHEHQDIEGSNTHGTGTAYDDLFADVRKWMKEGWIDYVAPQLYHRIGHKLVDFSTLEKWWGQNSFGRNVYTGHALYKLADGKEKGWKEPDGLMEQISMTRQNKNTNGICLYRSWSYFLNPWSIRDSLSNHYFQHIALPPKTPWLDSIPPNGPKNINLMSDTNFISLDWKAPDRAIDGDTADAYVIYRFKATEPLNFNNSSKIVALTKKTNYLDLKADKSKDYVYIVRTLDRLNNESNTFLGAYYKSGEQNLD